MINDERSTIHETRRLSTLVQEGLPHRVVRYPRRQHLGDQRRAHCKRNKSRHQLQDPMGKSCVKHGRKEGEGTIIQCSATSGYPRTHGEHPAQGSQIHLWSPALRGSKGQSRVKAGSCVTLVTHERTHARTWKRRKTSKECEREVPFAKREIA